MILLLYLAIPLYIDPIPCPSWVSYIDNYIPFLWWMVIPYYFYYFLIISPPFIISNKDKLVCLTNSLILVSIISYFFYCIWPISSSEVLFQVSNNNLSVMHNMITFDYLHQNAFPSMHVAVSCLIGYVLINEMPNYQLVIRVIVILVFFATFLIKQHYILDSIAGLFLGYLGILNYKKCSIYKC